MEVSELRELLSTDGLRLLDSLPAYDSKSDVVRSVAELRKAGHSPGLVAAVLSQARLRARANAKFGPFAKQLLFTEDGLEQATRLRVAAMHAGRYRDAGLRHVADLGCGIGADAIALAALDIEVTAVERDEVTAAIAAYNLAAWSNVEVVNADATQFDLTGHDGVYLDPARRDGTKRLKNPADWSPTLEFAFGLAASLPTGVKLGPGIDRELIPAGVEAQWVSVDGDVVELGVWSGPLARYGVGRAALVIRESGTAELVAATDSADAEVGDLGGFVYEPDGAVIRSRLIGDLARTLDARMLDHKIAYLTGDIPIDSPFASCFRVIETFAYDERQLTRELASREIGTLEIKKRGVDIDPSTLRKRLHLTGDASATLIVTRVGERRLAILCERV
jgi:THUMP domain-like/Methyltransferase small domain